MVSGRLCVDVASVAARDVTQDRAWASMLRHESSQRAGGQGEECVEPEVSWGRWPEPRTV